ncbi:5-demethoxyubiquinol-8 5-hydroxylase UbiM [Paraburkholderia sp. Tr-20389]|uniref:5-demethoxyubiquinol-8 5-hydroxylase UbiM n=1 Tax=Paraburkholderia sp. Tr-20389 TaxID=2703903 RepID=UPI001980FE28|nr:5-demethoxyubiquinol-8 5-hydroxylase UbiM [Paraburkholderia sp. Tr-20389]MBN3757716.1 5-demethoxyubiquinol-8 5-hydroxylase UbiM [Paraburkholderia sp. Tr-20389]
METDVTIVGAGPAGLCLARSLSGRGLKIVVIDQQPLRELETPAFDGREIALSHKSVAIMKRLSLWQIIGEDAQSQLRDAKIFNGSSPEALEIGHSLGIHAELGWLVPNHLIRQAAWRSVQRSMADNGDITVMAAEKVSGVKTGSTSGRVTLESGNSVVSRLVVAADSRFSATRRQMGIPANMHDHGKSMLVCRMTHSEPHHHVAWEWFGFGQTLAVLPMNAEPDTGAHRSSIVVTLPGREADALANMAPDEFSRNIERRFERRLGSMHLASTRHVYPLVSVYPRRFVARRFATVGDAAVGMHPVTAHGFNFGLMGVEALSGEILAAHRNGQDIAREAVLQRYEARHRRATRPLYLMTRLVTDIYTNCSPPARMARSILLHAAEHFTPFKKGIAFALSG